MNGVVDVGGGLRDIYGAGVFDRCIDDGVVFDYGIGVSAGSANISSYAAGQKGRNYSFYHDYPFRKEYMGFGNMLKTGSFLSVDYVYGALSNEDGENPLDYDGFCSFPGTVKTVATDALTGQPHYFEKTDYVRNDYSVLKASCSLPVVCRPCVIGGVPYYDGGLSDPVPVEKAFEDGCEKVVLILTKPIGAELANLRNNTAAVLLQLRYPNLSRAIRAMGEKYHSCVRQSQKYERDGRVLIIAPDDCCGLKTLTKDRDKLDEMYRKGYADAGKIKSFLA